MNKSLRLGLAGLGMTFSVSLAAQEASSEQYIPNIVVTATRTEIDTRDAPGGYSQISSEDIERSAYNSVADVLRTVPGLTLDNEQDGRSQIRVRGFEPYQTLVLINGRRVNNTDALLGHSDFRMTQIPMAAVQRIEVVRGPTSSLYGADALGGVINAILRPPTEEWAGRAFVRGGGVPSRDGGSEYSASLYTAGSISEQVGVLMSLDYTDRDGILNPNQSGIDEIEARKALNGFGSVFYRPAPGHEVEAFLSFSDDERTARRGTAATREQEILRYSTGVRHDYTGEGFNTRADIYRSRSDTQSPHLNREDQHTDDIVDLSGSMHWAGNQQLTMGADYRREHFWRDRDQVREHDDQVEHWGAIVQNRGNLFDEQLILTLGTRYDYHSRYDGAFSPRAGLVYAFTDETRFKLDYGRGFSAPDLRRAAQDYDFTFTTIPLRILGNADLEPERSDSVSVALEYEDEALRAGLTLFNNDVKDLIDLRCIEHCGPSGPPEGELELRTYINVDSARTRGAEFEVAYEAESGVLTRLNYTYLDARNRDTGAVLLRRPRQRVNLLTEISPWRDALAHMRVEYIGEQQLSGGRARDYTLFHVGASQALGDQWLVRLGIENLTNQRLADVDEKFTNAIRGRFMYASLSWEF